MKTVALGPFSGINNRLPDAQLQTTGPSGRKTGDFLRNAVNVDLTDAGTPRRRAGTTLAVAGEDVHSLWADKQATLYMDDTDLCTLNGVGAKQVIRSGLGRGLRASYARVGGEIYWTNTAVIERITNGNSRASGVPVPNPQPVVAAITGGSLPAGKYQIAITAVAADLEESGSTWPVQVEVLDDGRIAITGIPVSAYGHNIYISPTNGDLLFLLDMIAPGVTSYTVATVGTLGRQLLAFGLAQMPPGHIVRAFNSRLLVASGNLLFYSEPYAPALRNPARGYIPFPERITIVVPAENGVYVVADQTYWLSGTDIDKCEIVPLFPYGAVEGTDGQTENKETVWWFSTKGLIMADTSGDAKNVQEADVAVDSAVFGAGLFRDQNGVKQIISSLSGANASVAAATSFMEAEVIRKESMLC